MSAFSRIRPAGWVVIVLALGGVGYGLWRLAGPHLPGLVARLRPADQEGARPRDGGADAGTAEARRDDGGKTPPSDESASAGRVLSPDLFPPPGPQLPPAEGTPAKLALPVLAAVPAPSSGALPQPGEVEAVRALVRGDADLAVASVVALAAVPEAADAKVRAVWYLGSSPADAALFPSCQPKLLRAGRAGAVRGSMGHFHLLAALAGEPLPELEMFDRDVELARAIGEKNVTSGALAPGRTRHKDESRCLALPRSAFALVVLRRTDRPLTPAQLSAVVALSQLPPPAPTDVASFFDSHRRAPGGFHALYKSAAAVWRKAGVIERGASASDVVDRSFLGPVAPEPVREDAAASRHGFPSWLDR